MLGLTAAACPSGAIAVGGASITCVFENSYTITAADVAAGYVVNTASTNGDSASPVDGTQGTPVSDVSDTATQPSSPGNVLGVVNPPAQNTSDPDPAISNSSDPQDDPTTALLFTPSVSLIKSATNLSWALGNNARVIDAGDEITYSFVVINDGTEDLDIAINAVSDPMLTNIVCVPATLQPGERTTCTADPYVVTDGDVDNGGVENSATVVATPLNCACVPTVSDVSDTGTNPSVEPVNNPEVNETPSPFNVNPNNVNDPTEDPTTVSFNSVTTPASLSLINSESLGGSSVKFNWKTDVESGNIGFMIYQRIDSEWFTVNEDIIPSKSLANIGSGQNSYEYIADNIESDWFAISDVDEKEKVTLYGPYKVGQQYGEEELRTEPMDWNNVEVSNKLNKESIKDRLDRLRKQ